MGEGSETSDEEEYVIYSYFESRPEFYAEQPGSSPKDAVLSAIKERDDEHLLPIGEGYQMERGGFHAIRKEDLHTFHHS